MTKSAVTVYRDKAKEWRWKAQAANGRIIAVSSEGYRRRTDCLSSLGLTWKILNVILDAETRRAETMHVKALEARCRQLEEHEVSMRPEIALVPGSDPLPVFDLITSVRCGGCGVEWREFKVYVPPERPSYRRSKAWKASSVFQAMLP